MHTTTDMSNKLGATLGFLILRVWLAVRAIVTGIEKFSGFETTETTVMIDGVPNTYNLVEEGAAKVYGASYYHGVPESMYKQLKGEPFIPEFFLKIYDATLGPLLLILGITLLLGIASRISLFLMGLLYTSLTFGLILLKQDAGVAWLGVHVLMIAVALFNAQHNRYAVLRKW